MRFLTHISKKGRVWLLSVGILTGVLLLAYALCLPNPLFQVPYSRVVESADGHLLGARIAKDGQWRFSPSDTIPDKFTKALIAYEDKRFYYHPGVDPLAIGRALLSNIRTSKTVSGASTLTMQTIRLSRAPRARTWGEKIMEAVLATRLEWRCSKQEIITLFAQHAPFGGNVVGLEAACQRYFGRSPSQLSWAEAALLAVLPNAPSLMHPGKNRLALMTKRNALLTRLYQEGTIDLQTYDLAQAEPLPQQTYAIPEHAYHLTERVGKELGDTYVRTTTDFQLQQRVNATAWRYNAHYRSNHVENLAVVVVHVATGTVRAYVGNIYDPLQPRRGGSVDVATAPRSSGSTLKPFLYAAMLDDGSLLPTQLVKDVPYHYKDFAPKNFTQTFDGAVPAHQVIERSLNVPSVYMLDRYGVERFHQLLQQVGFQTINKDPMHYGLSLILGGAEITLCDLVQAYYHQAAQLNQVKDPTFPIYKDITYNAADSLPSQRATLTEPPLSNASLYLLFESLSRLNRPEEEAQWERFSHGRKVAWKTGTSWGHRDAWSIGVTPEYVVGVWVGNADGEGRAQLTGVGYAAPLLFEVFSLLPETGWFARPEVELERLAVCRQSGHPASALCPQVDTLWVPRVSHRPDPCPYHVAVHLSPDGAYRVNSSCCPVSQIQTVPWFVLPPIQAWYYSQTHLDYRPLPPLHPMLEQGALNRSRLEILYPQPGDIVSTPRDLDGQRQGAIFRAMHHDSQALLFWHLDNQFLGTTSNGEHQITISPVPGRHLLQVTDSYGADATVSFTVSDL